jgi:hypothetical protein
MQACAAHSLDQADQWVALQFEQRQGQTCHQGQRSRLVQLVPASSMTAAAPAAAVDAYVLCTKLYKHQLQRTR